MADNKTQLPQTLLNNPPLLKKLRDEFGTLYDENSRPFKGKEDLAENFIDQLEKLGVQDLSVKQIGIALEEGYETITQSPIYSESATTTTPEYKESNTTAFRSDQINPLIEKAEARQEAINKADQEAIQKTQEFLEKEYKRAERLKQIIDRIENKQIYVKTNKPEPKELSVQERAAIQTFREEAKINSPELFQDISQEMEKRILPTKPIEIPTEEVQTQIKLAALDTVKTFNDDSLLIKTVLIKEIASKPEVLKEIVPDVADQKEFKGIAELLKDHSVTQYEINREYLAAAFNEGLTEEIIGPKDISNIVIEDISLTPQDGYEKFDLQEIQNRHSDSIDRQREFFRDSFHDFSREGIRSHVITSTNSWIEAQVAALPRDSFAARMYDHKLVQAGLSYFGLGTPVEWTATNAFGKLAMSSGWGPTLGWVGEWGGFKTGITRVAGEAGKKVIEQGVGEVAGKIAVDAGTKVTTGGSIAAGITAAFAWTGPLAPVIGAIGGFLASSAIGKFVGDLFSKAKVLILKNQDKILAIGSVGLVAGLALRSPLLIAAGVPFAGAALLRGVMGKGFGGVGRGIRNFIGWAAAFLFVSFGIQILIGFIGLSVLTIIILFIINSGAYVVPPGVATQISDNPYIDVIKEASPKGPFKNGDSQLGKITYTITVKAKKSNLANIRFEHECKVIQKGSQNECPAPNPVTPDTISPGSPFTFTYDADYSGGDPYEDALVINTFEVTADVPEEKGINTAGSATITIGTPPSDCLQVDGNWPANYKKNIESAIAKLVSGYSGYVSKVCTAYPGGLPLRFNPSGNANYWGWNRRTSVDFYALGVKNEADALYTLAHELGHSLIWGVPGIFPKYLITRGILTETPVCFYSYGGDINEKLPEAIAFHVIKPRCGDVKTKYPAHYQFIINNVFN